MLPVPLSLAAKNAALAALTGLFALGFLLVEPHLEGRNAHATLFEIYFKDLFLAYAYMASIPFFMALHQAFQVLGHIRHDRTFSSATLDSLRRIKHCLIIFVGLVLLSFVFMVGGDREDRPPGIFMRLLVALPSIIAATTVAMFERILQNALNVKSRENQ